MDYLEAQHVELPLNPFKRRRMVAEYIADMTLPGITILPKPFLKGRGDLVRYAAAVEAAALVVERGFSEEEEEVSAALAFGAECGFETALGLRPRATIIINKGELINHG